MCVREMFTGLCHHGGNRIRDGEIHKSPGQIPAQTRYLERPYIPLGLKGGLISEWEARSGLSTASPWPLPRPLQGAEPARRLSRGGRYRGGTGSGWRQGREGGRGRTHRTCALRPGQRRPGPPAPRDAEDPQGKPRHRFPPASSRGTATGPRESSRAPSENHHLEAGSQRRHKLQDFYDEAWFQNSPN